MLSPVNNDARSSARDGQSEMQLPRAEGPTDETSSETQVTTATVRLHLFSISIWCLSSKSSSFSPVGDDGAAVDAPSELSSCFLRFLTFCCNRATCVYQQLRQHTQ